MRSIVVVLFLVILNSTVLLASSFAERHTHCEEVRELFAAHFSEKEGLSEIVRRFEEERHSFEKQKLSEAYCLGLHEDLKDKFLAQSNGLLLTSDLVIKHAVEFERFRLATYLASGVAPKRYFGFFDEQGDTAHYEKILRSTTIEAVHIINEYAARNNLSVRISEKEVALTFLAEGGALLLSHPEASLNKVHPVRHVGLDNFRLGFKHFPKLVNELDATLNTRLNNLLISFGSKSLLVRPMTFREAILGTAIMYLYEKQLAASFMQKEWKVSIMSLPLIKQFISTSLVYNCGVLFSKERVDQIEAFSTGAYLDEINRKSGRPKLEIYSQSESKQRLQSGEKIPQQRTSWSAVCHILQRYGAWVALEKYSTIFKEGEFRERI